MELYHKIDLSTIIFKQRYLQIDLTFEGTSVILLSPQGYLEIRAHTLSSLTLYIRNREQEECARRS